ncbi:MAG: hypothetical protein M9952_10820 [Microthrixaceae bacterium]|nr:hypothetical protein [Microthrixaceae bacterium]
MYPSPSDPLSAPVWENYVVAQVVQASLGLIPEGALAVGVRVEGTLVSLVVQLSESTSRESDDIDDIRTTLDDLLGPEVSVEVITEHLRDRRVSPYDGIRWVYLRRVED